MKTKISTTNTVNDCLFPYFFFLLHNPTTPLLYKPDIHSLHKELGIGFLVLIYGIRPLRSKSTSDHIILVAPEYRGY